MILQTKVDAFYDLTCAPQTSIYTNIAKLFTHPCNLKYTILKLFKKNNYFYTYLVLWNIIVKLYLFFYCLNIYCSFIFKRSFYVFLDYINQTLKYGIDCAEIDSTVIAFLFARQGCFEGPYVFGTYPDWFEVRNYS